MIKYLQVASIGVSDQDRALDFYINKLGFKLQGETKLPDGMRWIGVMPEGSQTYFSLEPSVDQRWVGGHSGYIFSTDDIDATYKELTERGVHFTQPPTFQGWGTYGEFEDPDGNKFGLAQAATQTA